MICLNLIMCKCFLHSSLLGKGLDRYNSDKVERVQRRTARFVKSRYSRYSSVSDMLDVLGLPPLSQRRQEARLIFYY